MADITSRGLSRSALRVHNNPVHPNKEIAQKADADVHKAVRLARLLEVPVVNGFSGLPAGTPGDSMPNWVTCPWPPHFLEILDYQWNEVTIPYWQGVAGYIEDQGVKFSFEMHLGMLVYNVETLLKLRNTGGTVLGCNFDPRQLCWTGEEPVGAIRKLGEASGVQGIITGYVDDLNIAVNGCNDNKPYDQILKRAWTFRSIGYGHGAAVWKDIISTLRLVGYDYVISIEHEDALMSTDEGLAKGVTLLKEANIFETPGEMFWA